MAGGAISRRDVLRGAVALSLSPLAASMARAADELSLTDVAAGIKVIAGAGGNVVTFATPAGLVVVDSGSAAKKDDLLATIAKVAKDENPSGKIVALINTHWHPDQTGGNEAIGMLGASIIAHAKTKQRLTAGWYVPKEDRYEKPIAAAGRPMRTFTGMDTAEFGGKRLELGYLIEAHTDGDIYVRFGDTNVIAAGDAISPERDPVLDWFGGGWLGGRVDALKKLLDFGDASTRYIPSFGPVLGRAEVQAEHDLMAAIFDRMVVNLRMGQTAVEMQKAGVLDGLPRTFADPAKFLYDAHKGFWAHHNKLMPDIV